MIHIFLDSLFILSIFFANGVGILSYYYKVSKKKLGIFHHLFYFFSCFFLVLKIMHLVYEFKRIYIYELIFLLGLSLFPIIRNGGKLHRNLGFFSMIIIGLVKIFPNWGIFQLTISL